MNKVDAYLNQFSGETKDRLVAIRKLVSSEVPEAKEGIMYDIVGYKLNDKPLLYFGGFTSHIGFYATPQGHKEFSTDLSKYKQGKGSVQFPHDKPLPLDLIKRMVRFRKLSLSE